MSLRECPLGRWAALVTVLIAHAAYPASVRGSCDSASLPGKVNVTELNANYPKDKISFPPNACIVDSASTTAGTDRTTYAEALTQDALDQVEAHFVKTLESAGFKPTALPTRDLLRSKARVHLRYAAPGATVFGGSVFKGTGVSVVLIEDSGFAGWRLIRVSITEKPG